jgi:hypothetical protein
MGFLFCLGHCIACEKTLCFNPDHVPSIRVDGSREPLCFNCFTRWNKIHREDKGLEPVQLHPNAYGPAEETGQ